MKNQKSENHYTECDKWNAPFLLAASFQNLIQFSGSYSRNGIVYWQFTPKDSALRLVELFRTRTEPHIPSYSLFEAIDTFWKQISYYKREAFNPPDSG